MVDVNTTAAALNNSAAVQGLMSNPVQADINRQALAAAFQRGNIALQGQIESQRQAALISAESSRQQAEIASQKGLESMRESSEASRQEAGIAGQRETQLQVEKQAEQAQVDLRNTAEAERIRADPMTAQLGIDLSKYDARNPSDNAKLVNDYQQAKTPDKMRQILTDQASRLTSSLGDAKTKIATYLNSPDGQKAQVMQMLSNPDVVNTLLQSHNFAGVGNGYTQAKLDALRSQAMVDAPGALSKLNADLTTATTNWGTGFRNVPAIAAVTAAKQQAINTILDPRTAPPALQSLYQTMGDLSSLRNNSIAQLGQYSPSPEQLQAATGTGTGGPLTDMLSKAGAGAPPPPTASGLPSPDISKLPPSPRELPTAGLDPATAAIMQANNLRIRQQTYDSSVTQPLADVTQKLQDVKQAMKSISNTPTSDQPAMGGSYPSLAMGTTASWRISPEQQTQQLYQLGQQVTALTAQQQKLLSIQQQFSDHASGAGVTQPAPPSTPAPTQQASLPSPYVLGNPGVNTFQLMGSNNLMNAAYGVPGTPSGQ